MDLQKHLPQSLDRACLEAEELLLQNQLSTIKDRIADQQHELNDAFLQAAIPLNAKLSRLLEKVPGTVRYEHFMDDDELEIDEKGMGEAVEYCMIVLAEELRRPLQRNELWALNVFKRLFCNLQRTRSLLGISLENSYKEDRREREDLL